LADYLPPRYDDWVFLALPGTKSIMSSHQTRWTAPKIAQRIALVESLVYRHRFPLPDFHFKRLNSPLDAPPVHETDYTDWSTVAPYSYWERQNTNFVMHTIIQIPVDWADASTLAIYLPLGEPGSFSHPEALAYIDGQPYAACDRHHQEIRLPDRIRDGNPHLLVLHGWTGNDNKDGENARLFMRPCYLVQIDQPTRDFIATARVAHGIAVVLDETNPVKDRLLTALDEAFKALDTREPFGDAFYDSIPRAHEILREGIARAGSPMDVTIVGTGHAHIDIAWLWTLGQVRRKAGRTFHTVLRLMEQFPGYHFTQSQPQLYDYVRQDYPELFEGIKSRIAEGRWETIGGMWVEADCNISGPESLARQFLLGRNFFHKHFGTADSPVLWLPDVFGYAWNLPQLIKQAGLEYFFTIKIGWNQYNRLPYDTFWWQGLDGTRVLTHFSPTKEVNSPYSSTYNANASPSDAIGTWLNFQQKEITQDLLMSYGYGDGGGGPTREMLENIREMADFPGTPHVKQGSVADFFHKLEVEHGDRLPTWNGELYLEIHRGTYTTQSRNKRANRKSEFLLHDAEFLASMALLLDPSYRYPASDFHQAWELICLNQFHDIIPGSSIREVYMESLEQYETVRKLAESARKSALHAIAVHQSGDIMLVNPTAFERLDLAFYTGEIPSGYHLEADGKTVPYQPTDGGVWIAAGEIKPYSLKSLQLVDGEIEPEITDLVVSTNCIENTFIRVEFNSDGDIVRIYDKIYQREILPRGMVANQFQAFEDRPVNWDAWDIDIFYDDRLWLSDPAESIKVIEVGPLRATLEIRRRILNSTYVQRVSLSYNSHRLDFDTAIDWRERHILLKVAFPVDILAPVATHEIQWGNVQRPTHRNTSWDWARFETCAQKWVDLSESDYGVSLLNDCKYGHDIQANIIRLSLLRAPTYPDPEADQGEHRFAYSLLPHAGDWRTSTIAAAYALNDPLITVSTLRGTSTLDLSTPLITTDSPSVVIETIKRAEDGNGFIIRLYESHRHRGRVRLNTNFDIAAAYKTNLLEEDAESLDVNGRRIAFHITPYQIMTIRIIPIT